MLFDVSPVAVAGQAATELAGAAESGGLLAGTAPALAVSAPMGIEEVSAAIDAAIIAHAAQFAAQVGAGIAQRGLYAAQLAVSGGAYGASDVLSAATLAL